jgi:hypothetical protein
MLLLLLVARAATDSISASDSVLVFAIDALASGLISSNQFILNSLYTSERAGIDPRNHDAVFAAVRSSRRLQEPAWHALMSRRFQRRASFITNSVECTQENEINATAFTAAAFAGPSVFIQSDFFIDSNCNGVFDDGDDSIFSGFNTSSANAPGGLFPLTDFQILEVVQQTSDSRLKRFITLVSAFNNTSAFNTTNNGTSSPLFFQPGMSSFFLPIMAAYQHVDHGQLVSVIAGEALYENSGNVEAPISFIAGFDTNCDSGATADRFNSAPVSNRFAYSTNLTGIGFGSTYPPGTVFGQCADAAVTFVIGTDINANLLGGVFFIDTNADGIRQPLEVTMQLADIEPLALVQNSTSSEFVFAQLANGQYLNTIQITGRGGSTTSAVSTAPTAATISAFLTNLSGRAPILAKDEEGLVPHADVCGDVEPRIRVGNRIIDNNSLTDTERAWFLNQAQADLTQSQSMGITPEAQFRAPNINIGFTCLRDFAEQAVDITAICDVDMVGANQASINDTFQITLTGNLPIRHSFATTVTVRPISGAAVDAQTIYSVLPFNTSASGNLTQLNFDYDDSINTDTSKLIAVSFVQNDRDVAENQVFNYSITLAIPYARTDQGLACAGVSGEEIVVEIVLIDHSGQITMVIGDIGALCRHTQPAECIGGGASSSNNGTTNGTAPGGRLSSTTDGTLAAALIYSGIALVIVFAIIAVSAQ